MRADKLASVGVALASALALASASALVRVLEPSLQSEEVQVLPSVHSTAVDRFSYSGECR